MSRIEVSGRAPEAPEGRPRPKDSRPADASAPARSAPGDAPAPEPTGGRAWLVYLLTGFVALGAFLFLPGFRMGPIFNLIGLSGAIAIVIAVRMHKPAQSTPWYLVAVGMTLFVGGDVITYNYEQFFGTETPFPSIGDLFYLLVYPFLVAGILMLIRRRSPGGDRSSLIDSLIVGVGLGTMSWVFLISPYVRDESLTMSQKLVAMGYPVMDLVLFTAFVRLAVGTGRRPAAFFLICSSVLVLFVTDSLYAWIVLHGGYDNTTGLLEGGWGAFYLLWGAGALHATMRLLDEPSPIREPKKPRRRLLLLAAASLLSPTVQFIQAARHASEPSDVMVIAACTIVLFALVLIRLNGAMVDVHSYRKAERQLREAEERYRSLVEGLPAVVYIAEFGEEGQWRYVSPQVETILGFHRQEFMSGPTFWRDRILPDDRAVALSAELQVLQGGTRMQTEYRITAPDGQVMWIREEAEPLRDDQGHPKYLQGVMYDITEQKRSEERLRQALETEKEASARLRSLHEMQNSFLQAVSHDLRTPLTSIMGCALTLERDEGELGDDDVKDLLHRMGANARKLHRMLTNLLDLDRMARGIVQPRRSYADLTRLARGVLEESATDTHAIELVNDGPVFANVDTAQVERILENLVTNAVRYTPVGTPIRVEIEEHNDGVLVCVDDAGPGIPPELRELIFEAFRQGDASPSHSPGVGIGLSLVARFAELHGGRAWVEESSTGGASFRVYLPHVVSEALGDVPVAASNAFPNVMGALPPARSSNAQGAAG
jgi:PAS domain S-box-containing protein